MFKYPFRMTQNLATAKTSISRTDSTRKWEHLYAPFQIFLAENLSKIIFQRETKSVSSISEIDEKRAIENMYALKLHNFRMLLRNTSICMLQLKYFW